MTRREFINGVFAGSTAAVAAGMVAGCRRVARGHGGNPAGSYTSRDGGDDFALCHRFLSGETWDFSPGARRTCDVVVIGGGLAGLTAARMLKKQGVDVLLLEKDADVGGQCRMDRSSAVPAAMASAFTDFPYNDDLIAFYTDLGVVTAIGDDGYPQVDERFVVKPPYDAHFIRGRWYPNPFADGGIARLPFSARIKSDLQAFADDMVTWYDYVGTDGRAAFDFPIDTRTSSDAAVRWLDTLTFAEYVAAKGWHPAVAAFFEPLIASELGASHDRVSAFAALCNISADISPADGEGVISRPGGNAHIAIKLQELIGGKGIINNAFVTRVVNRRGGVDVACLIRGRPATIHAGAAIFAAPMFMAPHLLPDMTAEKKNAVAHLQYAAYVVANVHVTETPRELVWISQIHGDGLISDVVLADWAGLADPASAPLSRPNILTVYAPLTGPNARQELLEEPLGHYENRILRELEAVVPTVWDTVTQFDLYRWGHPMLVPTSGSIFSERRRAIKRPLGAIFFAGHECEGIPIIDSAIVSGMHAAREVLHRS